MLRADVGVRMFVIYLSSPRVLGLNDFRSPSLLPTLS